MAEEKIWFFCIHCKRCFEVDKDLCHQETGETGTTPGWHITEIEDNRCLYPDCDGHFGDIWSWGHVRKDILEESGVELPEEPEVV